MLRSITVISSCHKMTSVGESSRTIMKNRFSTRLQDDSFIHIQPSVDHLPIIQKSITGLS